MEEDISTNELDQMDNTERATIQYEVGEICKCYYTEIYKNVSPKISQQINKCQGYCKIIANNTEDAKQYTVIMFNGEGTTKKLPGRCLRKVELTPFNYKEAVDCIGKVIETTGENTEKVTIVIASVQEDSNGVVMVNTIPVDELMDDFIFKETGAPCCNIKMLNAEEAFKA